MKIITVRDNIFLKELEIGDAAHIFKAIDSQREYLGEWLPFVEFTKSVKDSLEYVNTVVSMVAPTTPVVDIHCMIERYI